MGRAEGGRQESFALGQHLPPASSRCALGEARATFAPIGRDAGERRRLRPVELPDSEQQGEHEQRLAESADGQPAHQQADQPLAFPSLSGFPPIEKRQREDSIPPSAAIRRKRAKAAVNRWSGLPVSKPRACAPRGARGGEYVRSRTAACGEGGALRSPCANGVDDVKGPPPSPPSRLCCLRSEPGLQGSPALRTVPSGWFPREVQLRPLCSLLSSSSLERSSEEIVRSSNASVVLRC